MYKLENLDVFVYKTIDSTNDEAKRIIKNNLQKSAVILAYQQTNGHGRAEKTWISDKGNLYCTLILTNVLPKTKKEFFCFVTAIAVYEALNSFKTLKNYSKYIKWPNDIIIDEKKICGILLESINYKSFEYLLIGIGINIKHAPKNFNTSATSLYKMGVKNLTPQKLLTKLMIIFAKYTYLWQINGEEFLISEWLKRSYPINSKIKFNYQNQIITGNFKGINNDGNILIQSKEAILSFSIGEVFNLC